MACYAPLKGYRTSSGGWTTNIRHSSRQEPMTIPCSRCIGCRLSKAQQWGVRIQHEAKYHAENSFLTLTYNDENLPDSYSIDLREIQLFVKRLRKKVRPTKIRFFACGEYGDQGLRPHYHLIIFGYGFPDKTPWRKKGEYLTYRSEILEDLWPFGHAEIGTVTAKSGGYVARYSLKKITGPPAVDHYSRLHPLTGELVRVEPEFITMSVKPGIGADWFHDFEGDAFPSGFLIQNGRKVGIPQYYKNKLRGRFKFTDLTLEDAIADDLTKMNAKGKKFLLDHQEDQTDKRLAVREECAVIRQSRINRGNGEGQ